MIFKTEGIVLGFIKYSETSIIVKIYTSRFGLQSYIVNGVRKSKSKSPISLYQPITLLEMEVYHKQGRNIHRIKDIRCLKIFISIPYQILKSSIAMFMTEIIFHCIKEEEKNEELYLFLKNKILALDDEQGAIADYPIYFLLQLSRYLGFAPLNNYDNNNSYFDLEKGRFTPFSPATLYQLNSTASAHLFQMMNRTISLHYEQRLVLLDNLLLYYKYHLGHFRDIKSVKVLHEVLK